MHQQKGKKSLIYFFLFILVGSINNKSFSNIKFDKIENIKVTGLNQIENSNIKKKIKDINLDNIFFINPDHINQIIDSNTLVEKYTVFKNYPSTIDIKIIKTNFLAQINNGGKIFIIGSNGKLSDNNLNNHKLPFIFGKPDVNEFLSFKTILDNSKFNYENIKNFYFFPSKRWDIELKNNIIIKLPKKNMKSSLDNAFQFMNNPDFKNINIIDARVQNQIIIND